MTNRDSELWTFYTTVHSLLQRLDFRKKGRPLSKRYRKVNTKIQKSHYRYLARIMVGLPEIYSLAMLELIFLRVLLL